MFYFILSILVITQVYTLIKITSFNKVKKESEEILEKYDGVTTLKKIPKKLHYKDIEPDFKTFYDFMTNIKLEGWNAVVTVDHYIRKDYCWSVNINSHDGLSLMSVRLRDYGDGDGVFLSTCVIRSGDYALVLNKDDGEISNDIVLFTWDYIIKHYEDENTETANHYKNTINEISYRLKTLNRSERLKNILEF